MRSSESFFLFSARVFPQLTGPSFFKAQSPKHFCIAKHVANAEPWNLFLVEKNSE
jgi:hypothetical protein